MKYVKFKKVKNFYGLIQYTTNDMCILGNFLTSDLENSKTAFRSWLTLDQDSVGGNLSFLIKQGNNIRIEDLYDNKETDNKPAFIISKEEYIKLLDMWVEVYNQKPDEILVTYEDGKINVEAINI